jgi:hypothetical protein
MEVNSSESRPDVAVVANATSSTKTPSMSPSSSYSSSNFKNALDAAKKVKLEENESNLIGDSGGGGESTRSIREPTNSMYDLNSADNNTPSSSNRNSARITKSNSTTGVNNISYNDNKQSPHSSKHSESIKSAPSLKKKKRVKMQNESSDLSIASTSRRENPVCNYESLSFVLRLRE